VWGADLTSERVAPDNSPVMGHRGVIASSACEGCIL
jgi:hypothetical protein